MRRAIFSAVMALSAALPAAAAAPAAEPPPVSRSYDLVYASAGGEEQKVDVVSPGVGRGPFPAVLVIHGGAWREGSKDENRRLLADFARRGYVALSPDYRLCPKFVFPAQVQDVKAAVRWLRTNAASLRVDPDRIGAMGFSAGGHLALMLGVTGLADGLDGPVPPGAPSSRVRAVVDFFGPVDLEAGDFSETSRSLLRDFLGGAAAEKRDAARRASPLTFIDSGDAPVLAFQGTHDPLVPYSQGVKLLQKLAAAGVAGRVEFLLGGGHGWWEGEDYGRTMEEAFEFFDRELKGSVGSGSAGPAPRPSPGE